VAVQRSELPAQRHSAPDCSAACRYVAMAARPRLRLRAVLPETDSRALRLRAAALDSAALRRAGSAIPKVVVLRLPAVRTAAALELALLRAGWAAPWAIAWRPAAVPEMARSSAALAMRARRLAESVVSAAQAAALPLEEPAAWDAVEAPQRAAVAWDAAAEPRQEVAAWVWAAEPQQEAAWAGVAALPRGAVLREVPDVPVAEPRAARPWAVPWVFRRGQPLPWPAPQPAVRFARTMHCLRIALP
jgi:hypothetical protein